MTQMATRLALSAPVPMSKCDELASEIHVFGVQQVINISI
jgi:hypothetical protein